MDFSTFLAFGSAAFCAAAGVSVFLKESRSAAHFWFASGMLVLSTEAVFDGLSVMARTPELVATRSALSLVAKAFLPGFWLLFSLTYARGNATEFTTRWRIPIIGLFALPLALLGGFPEEWIKGVELTGSGDYVFVRGSAGRILDVVFMITAVFILMNLENTFRSSLGTMRWRIKFLILGVAELFIIRIYTTSQSVLFSAATLSHKTINAGALLIACLFVTRSLFRGDVFGVDIYPSQKMLYASFAFVLAGLYLFTVGVMANVVRWFGGGEGLVPYSFIVVIALVGLGAFGSSERLRQRARLFVSRNFQRPLHDYRQVWTTFTEQTSSLMNETDLCRAVVNLVSQTFDVLSATIWRVEPGGDRLGFAASTSLSESHAKELAESQTHVSQLIRHLEQHPSPVDLDSSDEPWVATIKGWNPASFRTGGRNILVPLLAQGKLMGIMTLSDRVNGLRFSIQDFDLLKCLADQAASDLLSIQLSHQVLRARQLEAFQTVSAFFVHDLKNTVSSLSLTLRNLPAHYDDPLFRQDALRAISNSVAHLNEMIARLSTLKQEIKLKLSDVDINAVIRKTLSEVDAEILSKVAATLHEPLQVYADSDQIGKVVTNLVLNASQAMVNGVGQIQVETTRRDGWAVLSVRDNGCGMSPDFLRDSLFRPFQTTKKNGTGIGMFQAKLIVEAHKGKIEVESRINQGTTFRILLPILHPTS